MVQAARAGRQKEAAVAEEMVEGELKKLCEHEQQLGVVPTIKLLRARFLEVAEAEVQRTLPRLNGLSEKDAHTIHAMAEAMVNKLLHVPLMKLKTEARENPETELASMVHALFDLHEQHDSAAPSASAMTDELAAAREGKR